VRAARPVSPGLAVRGVAAQRLLVWLLLCAVLPDVQATAPRAVTVVQPVPAPLAAPAPALAPAPAPLGARAAQDASVESADDLAFLDELVKEFRRGGSHSALRELDEYLADFPASRTARELAMRVALDHGDLAQAEAHLAAVPDLDPALRARLALRRGRYEDALALAREGSLPALASARLEVEALDVLGQRQAAKQRARAVTDGVDDRTLDGPALADLGWLYAFQRRYDLAAQALVFADEACNGRRGASYRLRRPDVLLGLARVYAAARQSGTGGKDLTLGALDEVLALDPGHAEALTVKAAVYGYGMNGLEANAALELALARDPTLPEALVLSGEMMLQARRIEDALAQAERVLAVDPRHRGALALRAVALAVGKQAPQAAAARERFASTHPESAALDALLGRVLQEHYRFQESVAPLERALLVEPDDEEPLAVLAQSLAHLGRESEARAALEEHRQRSPFPYPWRENMLAVLARLGDAYEFTTPDGFRLRIPEQEQDVLGVLLPARLGAAKADIGTRWGYQPEEEVLVEVFDVHADFSVRTVGFEGFFALGACFGNVVTLVSPRSELRGSFRWDQTAVHEYAHVVTLGLSKQRMPRWLSEGISVLEEKKAHPDWSRALERDVLDARANGLVFPVVRLDEAFQDGSTAMLGYYLGSLVCEVVEQDFGFDRLVALVRAYADGSSTREAVQATLEISPEELDARLHRYIGTVVAARAAIRPRYDEHGKDLLRARVQQGDEPALAELAWAYHDLGQVVDRDNALRRARERRPDEPALLRLEAEIALEAGRRDEALALLLRWSQGELVEADGLLQLARLQLARDDRAAALEAARRARTLYPGDTSPHGALALLHELLDGEAPEERAEWLDVLESIRRYDDVARQPRQELAREALAAGDIGSAARLLDEVVTIDPYDPETRMRLAELYVRLARMNEARAQWELVLGMRADQVLQAESGGPLAALMDEGLQEHQAEARRLLGEHAGDSR